jgi:hypothetical protein
MVSVIENNKEIWISDKFKTKYMDCRCKNFSHVIRFMYTNYENESDMYVEAIKTPWFNFFQRLYVGINYIFNLQRSDFLEDLLKVNSPYSDELDIIWSKDQCKELIDFLNEFVNKVENNNG